MQVVGEAEHTQFESTGIPPCADTIACASPSALRYEQPNPFVRRTPVESTSLPGTHCNGRICQETFSFLQPAGAQEHRREDGKNVGDGYGYEGDENQVRGKGKG